MPVDTTALVALAVALISLLVHLALFLWPRKRKPAVKSPDAIADLLDRLTGIEATLSENAAVIAEHDKDLVQIERFQGQHEETSAKMLEVLKLHHRRITALRQTVAYLGGD